MDFESVLADYLAGRPEAERAAREIAMRANRAALVKALDKAASMPVRRAFPIVTAGARIVTLSMTHLPLQWPIMVNEPGCIVPDFLEPHQVFRIFGDWMAAEAEARKKKADKKPRGRPRSRKSHPHG